MSPRVLISDHSHIACLLVGWRCRKVGRDAVSRLVVVIWRGAQATEMPPLMLIAWPVMRLAAGPARKTAIAARSVASATPRWAIAAAFSNILALNGSPAISVAPGVPPINDGGKRLMRVPSRLASSPAAREHVTMRALRR